MAINIVPVIKKNGQVRVSIYSQNLNLATLKDEYVMPIVDMLIDATSSHGILIFMDRYLGYNRIFVTELDVHKIAFKCLSVLRVNKWIIMQFGLKNVCATYQGAMNAIFHDLIGKNMKVYIDDVVMKLRDMDQHLVDLE